MHVAVGPWVPGAASFATPSSVDRDFGTAETGIKRRLRRTSPRSAFSPWDYQSAGPVIAVNSPVKSSEHGPQALRWAAIPG